MGEVDAELLQALEVRRARDRHRLQRHPSGGRRYARGLEQVEGSASAAGSSPVRRQAWATTRSPARRRSSPARSSRTRSTPRPARPRAARQVPVGAGPCVEPRGQQPCPQAPSRKPWRPRALRRAGHGQRSRASPRSRPAATHRKPKPPARSNRRGRCRAPPPRMCPRESARLRRTYRKARRTALITLDGSSGSGHGAAEIASTMPPTFSSGRALATSAWLTIPTSFWPSITGRRRTACSDITLSASSDRVVGADRDRLALTELAGRDAGRVLALGDHLDDDVAVGEHPLEAVVLAADRHRADLQLGELLGRIADRLLLAHALARAGHHIAGCLAHLESLPRFAFRGACPALKQRNVDRSASHRVRHAQLAVRAGLVEGARGPAQHQHSQR